MEHLVFAREALDDALWDEALPLLQAHYAEVAHFKDIPLDPDRSVYAEAEHAGILRVFTARMPLFSQRNGLKPLQSAPLMGYAVFFVRPNPHYCGSLQAVQDVIYVAPNMRGLASWKFVRYCDDALAMEGVQAIYQHLKASKDWGKVLERMGYELVDQIYARRLDAHSALGNAPDMVRDSRVEAGV